jgi:hypothetical protein
MISVNLTCTYCQQTFRRLKAQHKHNKKRKRKPFCSRQCINNYYTKTIELKCQQCYKSFTKKPASIGTNNFCSRSCAVTYNNLTKSKNGKLKPYYCKYCYKLIATGWQELSTKNNTKTTCQECNPNYTNWSTINIKDFKQQFKSIHQFNSRIRSLARSLYKKHNKKLMCQNCNYNLHCEICHIKPISSFPDTTSVADINNIDNLICLCRNCHWELDHGYLKF